MAASQGCACDTLGDLLVPKEPSLARKNVSGSSPAQTACTRAANVSVANAGTMERSVRPTPNGLACASEALTVSQRGRRIGHPDQRGAGLDDGTRHRRARQYHNGEWGALGDLATRRAIGATLRRGRARAREFRFGLLVSTACKLLVGHGPLVALIARVVGART